MTIKFHIEIQGTKIFNMLIYFKYLTIFIHEKINNADESV